MKNKTKKDIKIGDLIILIIFIFIIIFTFNGIVHFVKIFFIQKSYISPNGSLESAYYYTLSAIIQSNSALLGLIVVAQIFAIPLINKTLKDYMELESKISFLGRTNQKIREYKGSNESLKRWLKVIYLPYIFLVITIIMALLLMKCTPGVSLLSGIIWVEVGAISLSIFIILNLISIIKDMHQINEEINVLLFQDNLTSDGIL